MFIYLLGNVAQILERMRVFYKYLDAKLLILGKLSMFKLP